MTGLRILPIRVPILPGEGLDSWLEALARRSGLSLTTFLHLAGIPQPFFTRTLVTATAPEILRALETCTGIPAGRLDRAVFPAGFPFGPRRQQRCRFCPQCLADRDGRTRLNWWLPWSFACTTHNALLQDACPGCTAPFRLDLPRLTHQRPPASCTAKTGSGPAICGTDLAAAEPAPLSPGHPLLPTQEWIDELLTRRDREQARSLFGDLNNCTPWLMRTINDADVHDMGPAVLASWRHRPDTAGVRTDRVKPLSAAVRGILAHAARPLLDPTTEAAAVEEARVLRQRQDTTRKLIPVGMDHLQWPQLSTRTRSRLLRAADPELAALDRIRLRTCTPHAELPDSAGDAVGQRIRNIPQLLWPGWAVRLMPRQGAEEVHFRAVASALLLVPGEPVLNARGITDRLHPYLNNSMTGTLKQILRAGHPDVLTAVCNLADHLDRHGSPIDYRRRRGVIPAEPITHRSWQQLCFRAGSHPGEQTTENNYAPRFVHAQRYLHQLLTGGDLTDPDHPLAWRSPADRSRYLAFPISLTAAQRTALHDHARVLLQQLHIDEPVVWEPPASCAHGLRLPGPELTDIDQDAVRHLVIDEGQRLTDAARQLGTTLAHIRFVLETVEPAPAASHFSSPLEAWRLRQRAGRILTREFLDREYAQGGRNLTQIARSVGLPRHVAVEQAKALGITIYRTRRPVAMDPKWLREQYLTRKRTTQDIAREIGTEDETVRRRLQRLGITLRSSGVHSSTAMLSKVDGRLPGDIRKAVEGSLDGWQRLHRFQIAMVFPNLQSAAAHLGAQRSALVTQFQRLESDIGEALFHRSAFGKPHRPTSRGQALLRRLSSNAVQERMQAALTELIPMPDAATLARAATAVTTRRPPSPLRPYDGITVPRIRVRAETLLLLRAILNNPTEEFYGAQISAETGINNGSLSPRLRQLHQAGWLTARLEDDNSWRQRATPGRGPGRRITYYALTADGRRAAIHEVETRATRSLPKQRASEADEETPQETSAQKDEATHISPRTLSPDQPFVTALSAEVESRAGLKREQTAQRRQPARCLFPTSVPGLPGRPPPDRAADPLGSNGLIEPVSAVVDTAGHLLIRLPRDIVEQLPLRPVIVVPLAAGATDQTLKLGRASKSVGVSHRPFEGISPQPDHPQTEVTEAVVRTPSTEDPLGSGPQIPREGVPGDLIQTHLELHYLPQRFTRQLVTEPGKSLLTAPSLPPTLFDPRPEGIDIHGHTLPSASDMAGPPTPPHPPQKATDHMDKPADISPGRLPIAAGHRTKS